MEVNRRAELRGPCAHCLRLEAAVDTAASALEDSASLTVRAKHQLVTQLRSILDKRRKV